MTLITRSVVSPEELLGALDDPNLAIIEVHATRPGSAVIPGARPVFWKDLAWHPRDRELASGELLSARLFELGAGTGSRIVLAGEPTQFAAYLLWTLRVRGFTDIGYLDGGLETWRALGAPTAADTPVTRTAPTEPLPVPDPTPAHEQLRIGRDEVRALLDDDSVVLLDYRTPQEYAGERVSGPTAPIDHGAERHGRIPGAKPLFFRELLDESGRLKPADQLRELVDGSIAGDPRLIVNYCRLSHRSTLGWIALSEVLGYDNVRVYDGSWTEWGSIVGFPIEK